MGSGLINALGGAAEGFAQEASADRARQFAAEENRRSQIGGFLQKIALDDTAHPYSRQTAVQELLKLHQTPYTKPYKFDPNVLVAPAEAQPTQTSGTPSFTPPPPPSGAPAPEVGPPATEQTAGGLGLTRPTAPPIQASYTPPPVPPGIFMTPEQQGEHAGAIAAGTTKGQLGGQIAARQEAIASGASPMALGLPIGAYGAYGQGDTMPAAVAAAQGIPLPAGIDPNGWIRVQRNRMGQIVGAYPAVEPAAYAPTTSEGFTYQQQRDGSVVAVPVTTTRQKQVPGAPSATPPPPPSSIRPEKGKTVGAKAPTPTIMIAPPEKPGGNPRVITATPGGTIPAAAVSVSGFSSTNVPTSGTRTRSEFATGLIPAVDRAIVDVTHAAPKLGALKGRWNEFIAGTLGGGLDDDPEISSLRTEIGLLQTGMMVPHVGARGGVQLIGKFKNLIDSGKASAPQLNASLKEMRKFLVTYASEGKLKGWGNEPVEDTAPPTPPKRSFNWADHPVINR